VVPNATGLQPLLAESPYGSKIARSQHRSGNGQRTMDASNTGRRAVPPAGKPQQVRP
jgi:hypothetical protein